MLLVRHVLEVGSYTSENQNIVKVPAFKSMRGSPWLALGKLRSTVVYSNIFLVSGHGT